MECGCEIDLEGEGPSCFKESNRKARKEHRCCECRRIISKGETYRFESGIWDGTPQSHKTCADCLSVRDEFFCSSIYGQVWESIAEHIDESGGEISTLKLAKLTPAARDRVCQIWEDWWEEYELEHPLRVALRLDARMGEFPWDKYRQKDWVRARMKDVEKISNAYGY